jgi:hypothetical protein
MSAAYRANGKRPNPRRHADLNDSSLARTGSFIGGTLQSFVRCSSDALSLRRSFPVLAGAAAAACSGSAAKVAEYGVTRQAMTVNRLASAGHDDGVAACESKHLFRSRP